MTLAVPVFLVAGIIAGGGVLRWVAWAIALFFGLLIWRVRTLGATTTDDGIIARGLLGARRFSWPQIQDTSLSCRVSARPRRRRTVLVDRELSLVRDGVLPTHVRVGVPRRHRPKAARNDIVTSPIPCRTVYAACNLATMS
jgi:hypothetical protein